MSKPLTSQPVIAALITSSDYQQRNGKSTRYLIMNFHSSKFSKQNKRILILKARGLGLTEFMLRYMAWLCLYDNKYKGADMPIIVGPNLKLAYKLIGRMKRIFDNRIYVDFNSAVTSLNLNGVNIEAFPSNNPDAFRGLEKPAFSLLMKQTSSRMKLTTKQEAQLREQVQSLIHGLSLSLPQTSQEDLLKVFPMNQKQILQTQVRL